MNKALFSQNGTCGYVLKSDYMRGLVPASRMVSVDIELISGSQIPKKPSGSKDIVDPYVTMELWSTEVPSKSNKFLKTPIVKNNGLNPRWNTKGKFAMVKDEINILLVKVFDDDDTLLCWNAFPANCIRSGYRAIEM